MLFGNVYVSENDFFGLASDFTEFELPSLTAVSSPWNAGPCGK